MPITAYWCYDLRWLRVDSVGDLRAEAVNEKRETKQLFGESPKEHETDAVAMNEVDAEPCLEEDDFDVAETEIGIPSPLLGIGGGMDDTIGIESDVFTSTARPSWGQVPADAGDEGDEGDGDDGDDELDNVDSLAIGEMLLERYQVELCIGAGGFGIVYRAQDRETGMVVAVKTLRRSLPEYKIAEKRFEREIALTRSLVSEHTLKILDYGKSKRGIHFFVMELLIGQTLDEYLEDGKRYNFVEVATVIEQVLRSLDEAHKQGIVHRDLKPSNIFLCEAPKNEFYIKVLDFGIAKITQDGDEAYNEKLTRTGSSFGSPAYMSPEQVSSGSLTAASDVYAVGLIMLEMLTGCPVFQGNTAFDVALQQLSPLAVVLPEWVKQSAMGSIIERCVQKKAVDRYADASALLADIVELNLEVLEEDYRKAQRSHFFSGTTAPVVAGVGGISGQGPATTSAVGAVSTKSHILLYSAIIAVGLIVVILLVLQLYFKIFNPETAKTSDAVVNDASVKAAVQAALQPKKELTEREKQILLASVVGAGAATIELRRVEITVASSPVSARLVRVRDGKDFGATPVKLSLIRSRMMENYVIQHPGYIDYPLPISSMRGETIAVTLAPKQNIAPPPSPKNTAAPKAAKPNKTKKNKKPVVVRVE
ncbi:MAG: serine/threonine-protein kinase [Bradymonadales bacterium]